MAATDQFENELPIQNTGKYIRALDASGNPILIPIEEVAKVVEELLPLASAGNNGLMSAEDSKTITKAVGYGVDSVVDLNTLPIGFSYFNAVNSTDFPSNSGCVLKFNFGGTTFLLGYFNGRFQARCLRDGIDSGWKKLLTE